MQKRIRKLLRSEAGDANYLSTLLFIFIAVILLAFILNIFTIISTKQQLDHAADQMVKQIQLSGGINSDTDELFDFLCSEINGASDIDYSIHSSYHTPPACGDAASYSTRYTILHHHHRPGGTRRLLEL